MLAADRITRVAAAKHFFTMSPFNLKFGFHVLVIPVFSLLLSGTAYAESNYDGTLQNISDEWAVAFYLMPVEQQPERFKALLPRLHQLQVQYPDRAEPLIQEAIVLCTLASSDWGLSSLSRVKQARELLVKSIDMDPRAMEGSAFITLGNLYFRLPGWPISYGDDKLARQYLEAAIKLFPNGLDSNYFLGDFLLQQGDYEQALIYLEKAEKVPIRPYQRLSDGKLKEQLGPALKAARTRDSGRADFFSSLLRDYADEKAKP